MNAILFVTKKIVSAFIQPVGLILLLWAIGIILWIRRGDSRAGFAPLLFGGLILLAAASPLLSGRLMRALELRAGPYADPAELQKKGVKFIVVLGGDVRTGNLTPADRIACSSLVRCLEAIRLWKGLPGAKLVLSGGSFTSHKMTTAEAMALFAQTQGVPREAIILETKSWDTGDEARLLKPVLGQEPFALVTSACHMWRSLIDFKRVGLRPISAPADFEARSLPISLDTLLPTAGSVMTAQKAAHEYLGVFAVFLKELMTGRSPVDGMPRKP
jgi:uncharacterized SAM-binding protein YcdF (DUF218 family)